MLFVEASEELLTANDSKGIQLLSKIVEKCSPSIIDKKTCLVLLDFFCSRLYDLKSIDSSLIAIQSLLNLNHIEDPNLITLGIFEQVKVQSLPFKTRNLIYQILSNISNFYYSKLSVDYINGVIRSVDGEKDPRNLMIVFELIKIIIQNLDYKNNLQDLFEVFFCYFPVTFTPPPNDPFGVTSEDLKVSLRNLISASPLFAPYAIPGLLEKLSSTSQNAKNDAIETISCCIPVYGFLSFRPYINDLWSSL